MDEKYKLLRNFDENLNIFDENSIENFQFLINFGIFVTKNGAFANNTIFLQQFFCFGGKFPPFPLATPLLKTILKLVCYSQVWNKSERNKISNKNKSYWKIMTGHLKRGLIDCQQPSETPQYLEKSSWPQSLKNWNLFLWTFENNL